MRLRVPSKQVFACLFCATTLVLSGVSIFAQLGYATAISIWRVLLPVIKTVVSVGIFFGVARAGWRYARRKFSPISYYIATNDSSPLKTLGSSGVTMLMEALTTRSRARYADNSSRLIVVLGQIADVSAAKALLELLRIDAYADMAEQELVKKGDPAIPVIADAIRRMKSNKQDAAVRARAINVLGNIGSFTAIINVRMALADENVYVRLQAATILMNKGIEPALDEEKLLYDGVAPLAEYLKLRQPDIDGDTDSGRAAIYAEPFTAEQTKTVIDCILRGMQFKVDYIPAKTHQERAGGWDWVRETHRTESVVDVPARWDISKGSLTGGPPVAAPLPAPSEREGVPLHPLVTEALRTSLVYHEENVL